jgi:hypothetical protein
VTEEENKTPLTSRQMRKFPESDRPDANKTSHPSTQQDDTPQTVKDAQLLERQRREQHPSKIPVQERSY